MLKQRFSFEAPTSRKVIKAGIALHCFDQSSSFDEEQQPEKKKDPKNGKTQKPKAARNERDIFTIADF